MRVKANPAFLLLELLIILLYMNPIGNLIPNYIQILVFGLWLLFVLVDGKKTIKMLKMAYGNIIIFLMVFIRCCLSGRININDYFSPIQMCIGWYQFLVYSILFVYVIELNRKEKDRIFIIAITSMVITSAFSIYYVVFVDPLAVRYSMIDRYWGTGDFQLIYAIAIFMGPLAMMIFRKNRMCKFRPFMIIGYCIMALCLLLCNLVTSLVIAFVSTIIAFLLEYAHRVKALLFGMLAIIGIILKNIWAGLILRIADSGVFFWGTSDKLRTVAALLMGSTDNLNTLDLRLRLVKKSFETFKKNWLFGVDFKEYGQDTLGSHNQWADDLGRFGALGNLLIWWNYIRLFRRTVHSIDSKHIKNALITVWLTFFIFGFLNPCLIGQVLAIIFVVVPTMYDKPEHMDKS